MFEINNYVKEYYINGKLIGKIILDNPDRKKNLVTLVKD